MQFEMNITQISLALLLIFGGLTFLYLSQQVVKKITQVEVIFPNDEEYQRKINTRNTHVRKLVLEWRILVLLEIVVTSLGGFLAAEYVGLIFFCTIIVISHYVNRSSIPETNYDPLDALLNRIVMVNIHGDSSTHNAKQSIINFIQTKYLSQSSIEQLLLYLEESQTIPDEVIKDINRMISF